MEWNQRNSFFSSTDDFNMIQKAENIMSICVKYTDTYLLSHRFYFKRVMDGSQLLISMFSSPKQPVQRSTSPHIPTSRI